MSRRFLAFLIVLSIGLQGPSLAYAAALTAKTMPTGCTSGTLEQSSYDNSSCCPDNMSAGLCCSGGVVFGGATTLPRPRIALPTRLVSPASGSDAFTTERPIPPLRPPIA